MSHTATLIAATLDQLLTLSVMFDGFAPRTILA
jgi:hypothetical protein